ncbi:nucleotidyltransferase domain-containing protein [Kribbella speibonae]|uniref:Nucleotidyltransferase domain-containing protein n=1 Tax=Kribbella speibonae TaxID=1572660 RepID=A0A4R0IXI6_9ACTN|nr:nucleotidyltransferase domain-containing protein [Kribbella speibonae]TCC37650.1 nucleotidyltransferase domain-containing protein [Kribbella speibonae]
MVTEAARRRRVMVRPVMDWYAAVDGVDAVMLGGSTARGDADRWSDIEVGVFWQRPPTEAERLAVAGAADVRLVNVGGPPWDDHLYLGEPRPEGLLVEVAHTLTQTVENSLDELLSGKPDGQVMQLAQGIIDGREVIGPRAELVARWQERVATYPRDLALAVVRYNGNIEKFWRWQMFYERDNPLLVAREFVRMTNQLLSVLYALNGRYSGHVLAFKRLDALALPLAPPSLPTRLRAVFDRPAPEGAQTLHDLIEETFDLVERHLPEVDVAALRATFRSDRKPLD